MDAETYHRMMQSKIIEMEENMTHQDQVASMILLQAEGKRLRQDPVEFFMNINNLEYKRRGIENMSLRKDDVVLDIGAGVGDLAMMISDRVKEVYALEFHEEIYDLAKPYLKEYSNIHYINTAFQDYSFPYPVTKCVMLAWHVNAMTLQGLAHRLGKETRCTRFVHNVGDSKSIHILDPKKPPLRHILRVMKGDKHINDFKNQESR